MRNLCLSICMKRLMQRRSEDPSCLMIPGRQSVEQDVHIGRKNFQKLGPEVRGQY